MTQKYLLPQEIELAFIVPAIRREYTSHLKSSGYDQHSIAKFLQVTDAAISQYASGKRGNELQFPKNILDEIHESADRLVSGKHIVTEMTTMLELMKQKGITCAVHMEKADLPTDCDLCQDQLIQIGG